MTAFEPDALGNLITGMEFHKFYFENGGWTLQLAGALGYNNEYKFRRGHFTFSARQELQDRQHDHLESARARVR